MKRGPLLLLCLAAVSSSLVVSQGDALEADELQASIDRVVEKVAPASVAVSGKYGGGFSAVIVSPEGHVLTAGHAVQPNADYRVILPDGREFEAKGVGVEPSLDMGLIKISDPQALPYAEMGWSASVEVNQPSISLGHPGALNKERGTVVRFGRIADVVAWNGMIRSTCLMEPGDSGGPLFDMNGRLIGIHSNINYSLNENYEVPIDRFRHYWKQLNTPDTFHAASLDAGPDFGLELTGTKSSSGHQHPHSRGPGGPRHGAKMPTAKIASIKEGGLAEQSGLSVGDRITAVDDETVQRNVEISRLLYDAYTLKKSSVAITLKRKGSEEVVQLELPVNAATYHQSDWSLGASVVESAPTSNPIEPIPELKSLIKQFAEVEDRLDTASVQLQSQFGDESRAAFATIISLAASDHNVTGSLEGAWPESVWLVSKSSLVGSNPIIELHNGTTTPATVINRDKEHDLVLLKAEREVGKGVELIASESADLPLGELLLSPHPRSEGRISVWGSATFEARKRESAGYLGVRPGAEDGKVVLFEVLEDGPAAAEFKKGDYLLAIDGKEVTTPQELIRELAKYEPGDRIDVSAMRDDKALSIGIKLGARPEGGRHIAHHFKGGKSKRRDGFPQVFSHDARLLPHECGGPLFTVDGDFVGVNIARFSRTRSYAVPAAVVRAFVKQSLSAL